ncbi:alanine racemase [bacterium]|nr:alanine racemase [candidate division CSSED10-310 bacterium]
MRITWAEIDLSAIKHNLTTIQQRVKPAKIIAVVKANAYGHGIIRVADAAVKSGVDFLGVGFLEEGLLLRRRGFKIPILVLGGVLFRQIQKFLLNRLDITVSSLGLAYAVNKAAAKLGTIANVHLKFDTGLNRIGISHRKASLVFERIVPLKNIKISGIYSHFATADEADKTFTELQIKRFENIIETAKSFHFEPEHIHIACSGAILQHPGSYYNMIRVGLIMYGLYPHLNYNPNLNVKPVLTFKSRVVFLKDVNEGEPISYGRIYYTQQRSKIATIPVGYGDGYNRRLSNKGNVLINGRRYPVVGTVCMDQIMVDLGPDSSVKIGDEVVLYGNQGTESIRVEEVASQIGTIPYEVTCWLARRVPRIFINPV